MGHFGVSFADRNLKITERFLKSSFRIHRRGLSRVPLSYPGELKKPIDETGDPLSPVGDLGRI